MGCSAGPPLGAQVVPKSDVVTHNSFCKHARCVYHCPVACPNLGGDHTDHRDTDYSCIGEVLWSCPCRLLPLALLTATSLSISDCLTATRLRPTSSRTPSSSP